MSFLRRVFGRWKNPHYARGILHYNRREYAPAVEAFERLLAAVRAPPTPAVELARFYAAEAHAKLGLALFRQGARVYGRSALMLSGGAALGFYHLGVVRALWLRGHAAIVLGAPDEAKGWPEVPKLIMTDNQRMMRWVIDGWVTKMPTFVGRAGKASMR